MHAPPAIPGSCSTTATRWPAAPAAAARVLPPLPHPMTSRSTFSSRMRILLHLTDSVLSTVAPAPGKMPREPDAVRTR